MTLDQIVKIQSIVDKRAIRSDTLEFLNQERFSNSKQCMIRYGDMHIDHFLTVYANNDKEEDVLKHIKQQIIREFCNGNN
jgi:hypothetical protein